MKKTILGITALTAILLSTLSFADSATDATAPTEEPMVESPEAPVEAAK